MPQYVVKLSHTAELCPSGNSKVRDRLAKSAAQLPQIAQQSGIRFIAGPLVMASEHESIAVVEAASFEAVNEFILRSGLMQWNSVRVSPAISLEQAMGEFEKMPPPIA